MHYFVFGPAFAAVQDAEQAQKHADAGWERTDATGFVAAWQARDGRDGERIKGGRATAAPTADDGVYYPGPAVEREVSGVRLLAKKHIA